MEGGGVGGEEEGLRGLGVEDAGWINRVTIIAPPKSQQKPEKNASSMWDRRVMYLCSGTPILLATRPVSVAATFTIPSVPAENS